LKLLAKIFALFAPHTVIVIKEINTIVVQILLLKYRNQIDNLISAEKGEIVTSEMCSPSSGAFFNVVLICLKIKVQRYVIAFQEFS
jgi:hypothetical protein